MLNWLKKLLFAGLVPPKPLFGGRSSEWHRVKAQHLLREPFCQACGGARDLEVHHIVPFHVHPGLELVDSNLITLCERPGRNCYYCFGHYWNWYSWNKDVRADVAAWRIKAQQRP